MYLRKTERISANRGATDGAITFELVLDSEMNLNWKKISDCWCFFVLVPLIELSLWIIYYKSFTKPNIFHQNREDFLISSPRLFFFFFVKRGCHKTDELFKAKSSFRIFKTLFRTFSEEISLAKRLCGQMSLRIISIFFKIFGCLWRA